MQLHRVRSGGEEFGIALIRDSRLSAVRILFPRELRHQPTQASFSTLYATAPSVPCVLKSEQLSPENTKGQSMEPISSYLQGLSFLPSLD